MPLPYNSIKLGDTGSVDGAFSETFVSRRGLYGCTVHLHSTAPRRGSMDYMDSEGAGGTTQLV